MYKVCENRKCTQWPQTVLEDLTDKSTLYTLNTYPWGPNFALFRSMISRFWDTACTRWAKIGNAPNDPKLNLSTWQSNVFYINLILTHDAQILFRFALRIAVSEIQHVQGQRKSKRMALNWTWTLNSQKYSICTKYIPWGPSCGQFCSAISRFRDTACKGWAKIGNEPNDPKLTLKS